ncbi:glycosyltransferase family 4 protein [Halomicroarcula limicola]|uniref:Glycosyltransferase family 4 protein n=1 Tax=Haloarcula limicola TaxID=1429915 RepID=A0A8J8C7P1_9EURY|nr:glycosyltransferase family 4 protein [Halomicroarcula limicola]MBV0925213.1 glycosyltransferase family 4 protein [Halomicroarcula limicola]
MEIIQVPHLYRPSIGGIENYAYRLNNSLSDAGHTTETITTDLSLDGGGPLEKDPNTKYCATTTTVYRNPVSIELYRRVRQSTADVYHLHSPWFLPTVEAAHAISRETPMILTIHGVVPPRHSVRARLLDKAYKPIAQYVLDCMDAVIVLGNSEKQSLLNRFNVPPGRVSVIPNGIRPKQYRVSETDVEAFNRKYGLDPATPTILSVCRLVPVKKPDVLVDAITTHLPDVDLDLVLIGSGDGEFFETLTDRADDRVTFLSTVDFDELQCAYHSSDVFAFTGTSEGLSTVVLEAMNASLPIVSTSAGALSDVITHGNNGWLLTTPPDATEVADAIQFYISNPDRRQAVGRRNRALVESSFDWEEIAARIEDLYQEVV